MLDAGAIRTDVDALVELHPVFRLDVYSSGSDVEAAVAML
jgi:hypothetical protein